MPSRFLLLMAIAASVLGCGEKDVSPTVPLEAPPKAVTAVSITLPEDLVQAGWSVTEIKPSELKECDSHWWRHPVGPPQFSTQIGP